MKVVLRPSFDIPVILLNQVIQIVVLPDGDDFFIGFVGVECSQRCRVGTTLPQVRRGVEWPCERSATPLQHPVWRSQDVDGLACSIHRAVQIFLILM